MKKLIKKLLRENLDYSLLETLLDEDYPTNFNFDTFKSLRTFADRMEYCRENLKRIGEGSSRVVYMVDNEKVLKLAKNRKGIAQNEVEISWGNDYYFGEILAKTLDSEDKGLWVEMELARRVTNDIFKNEYGFDIKYLFYYMMNWKSTSNGGHKVYGLEQAIEEQLDQSDFVRVLCEFAKAQDAPVGDLCKLTSYGLVQRDGQDSVVLIDFGLTSDIYTSYYR